MVFKGENILLGVTGGIAAYKAVELCRLLGKEGASVRVAMTKNACLFVTPLTFKTVSNNQVYTDLFMPDQEFKVRHISLANWADTIVVAPATANTIAKFALGLADDLLSTLFLARSDKPVYIAPAMNDRMYHNAVVQKNITSLKQQGINIIEGETGELACGEIGSGRMAEPKDIVAGIARSRSNRAELKGKRVLVTAGPTREPLDPVRFLSNYSSGKMGYALAEAAAENGAAVTLISGPAQIDAPAAVKLIPVETAREMYEAVLAFAPEADIIIKAAAVSDYRPVSFSEQKIKKGADLFSLSLERTPDILAALGDMKKPNQILVGFAAETENLLKNAREKLFAKKLDLMAANDVSQPDRGFGAETNQLELLYPDGEVKTIPMAKKKEVARALMGEIIKIYNQPGC